MKDLLAPRKGFFYGSDNIPTSYKFPTPNGNSQMERSGGWANTYGIPGGQMTPSEIRNERRYPPTNRENTAQLLTRLGMEPKDYGFN